MNNSFNEKLQTHSYDHKLKDIYNNYTFLKTTLNSTDIINEINNLKTKILSSTHIQKTLAIKSIDLIINDKKNNIDHTNNIQADILLYYVAKRADECLDDIILQLSDIVSKGPCAQGRCTRLGQLFFCLY